MQRYVPQVSFTDEEPCCIDRKLCTVRRNISFRVHEHEIRFLCDLQDKTINIKGYISKEIAHLDRRKMNS
jgi:hypothetical protein